VYKMPASTPAPIARLTALPIGEFSHAAWCSCRLQRQVV
jgi:hypothetical protein